MAADRLIAAGARFVDHLARLSQIDPADQMFDRPDRSRTHRQGSEPHGSKTHRFDRAPGILATETDRRISFVATARDLLDETQKTDIERYRAIIAELKLRK